MDDDSAHLGDVDDRRAEDIAIELDRTGRSGDREERSEEVALFGRPLVVWVPVRPDVVFMPSRYKAGQGWRLENHDTMSDAVTIVRA